MLAGDTQIQPQWWVLQILLYLLSLGLQWLQVVGDIFQLFFKVTWFTEGHEKEGKQKKKRKQRQQFETKNRRWRGDQTNPGSEGQVNMSLWLKPHLEAEFIHEKQYCIWKLRILKPITTSNEQQKHKRRKYYNINSPIYLHSHVFFIYLFFFLFSESESQCPMWFLNIKANYQMECYDKLEEMCHWVEVVLYPETTTIRLLQAWNQLQRQRHVTRVQTTHKVKAAHRHECIRSKHSENKIWHYKLNKDWTQQQFPQRVVNNV